MNNPLTKFLQSLPERVRLGIYALLFVGGVVWAAFQAAGGDWKKAVGILLGSVLGGALPASNTPTVRAKTTKPEGR